MRRALVTGSAGFIGRHMVNELDARGWDVVGCDVRNGDDALKLFASEATKFDLVVHCAYWVGGRAAIDTNPLLLAKNLELDAAMLDWAVRLRQSRVLYFSSSAAYPKHLQAQDGYKLLESYIDLDNAREPDANYGWAKLTGERLARAASEFVPVHVVRPFSGYGEDQDHTYPFRAILERARRREDPFTIWGPGTQVRDWIHVDDVVSGSLAIVDADVREPVNLCTGIPTSMLSLAGMACEEVGFWPEFEPKPDAPTGVHYRVGDPTKFHQIYQPQVSLLDGVKRALAT